MKRSTHTFSLKADEKKWLRRIRKYAVLCPGHIDTNLRIFDPAEAKLRHYIVAPFIEVLNPSTPKFIDTLKKNSLKRLFLATFPDDKETLASAEIDGRSIWAIMVRCLRHCILVPRDESVFVFSSEFDYWLIAGPRPFVEELAGMPLAQTFSEFRAVLQEGNVFDPPDEFFEIMLSLYERHNAEVEQMSRKTTSHKKSKSNL